MATGPLICKRTSYRTALVLPCVTYGGRWRHRCGRGRKERPRSRDWQRGRRRGCVHPHPPASGAAVAVLCERGASCRPRGIATGSTGFGNATTGLAGPTNHLHFPPPTRDKIAMADTEILSRNYNRNSIGNNWEIYGIRKKQNI